MALVTINGQPIADPTGVQVGQFRLTKATRTASGRMAMEIIAIKRKLELEWDKIAEPDLKFVLNLLEGQTFHQVAYPDPQGAAGELTITTYVGDINKRTWHRVGGIRHWEQVRIGLIER